MPAFQTNHRLASPLQYFYSCTTCGRRRLPHAHFIKSVSKVRENTTCGDRLTEGVSSKLQFLTPKDYTGLFSKLSEAATAYAIAKDHDGTKVDYLRKFATNVFCHQGSTLLFPKWRRWVPIPNYTWRSLDADESYRTSNMRCLSPSAQTNRRLRDLMCSRPTSHYSEYGSRRTIIKQSIHYPATNPWVRLCWWCSTAVPWHAATGGADCESGAEFGAIR